MNDYGKFLEVLNNKADRDLRNINPYNTDVIIEYQEPTSDNGYTWYRLYASGWVEQGGIIIAPSDAAYVKTLPITMIDTKYTVMITRDVGTDYNSNINGRWQEVYNKTTTSFTTWGVYASKPNIMWHVFGKANMTGHIVPIVVQEKEEFEHRVIAFQKPTSANGYKWYRKYADGWVEQGGKDWLENNTITFPVTMADTNYYVSCGGFVIANHGRQLVTKYVDKITASSDGQTCGMSGWLVMGMAA